jgi:hypothetical protein
MTLAIRDNSGHLSLPDKLDYARALSVASLLPKHFQNNPGNLLFALEYAEALDIKPIHAITSIHVIEGKPSASADLIAAVIRRAGHKLRVTGDDKRAVAQLIRADDPDFTYEATWDMEKARNAGLTGKGVWKAYPGAMLRSRAITEVARMGASDALFGVVYTPEELGSEVDAEGAPIKDTYAAPERSALNRLREAVPEAPPETVAPAEAEAMITAAQLRKLHTVLTATKLTEREAGLAAISTIVSRDIDSSKELTKAEAGHVIDVLEQAEREAAASPADDAEIVPGDGPTAEDIAALNAETTPDDQFGAGR